MSILSAIGEIGRQETGAFSSVYANTKVHSPLDELTGVESLSALITFTWTRSFFGLNSIDMRR